MNYYPRFPAHYQTKTLHLTMEQDGAYNRLLDWYYANERPIPHAQRYAIGRAMTASERRSVDAVLAEFFTLDGEHWHQYRADAEIEKARAAIDAARKNGAKGGRPRKNPDPPPEETPGKPSGFPVGSSGETQDEPSAKAHQPPYTTTTPDRSLRAERSLSARAPNSEPSAAAAEPAPTPITAAGAACRAMRRGGLMQTNPSHQGLLAAIAEGATDDAWEHTASEAVAVGKGFAWVIATVRGRLHDAARNPAGANHAAAYTGGRTSLADRVATANRIHDDRELASG